MTALANIHLYIVQWKEMPLSKASCLLLALIFSPAANAQSDFEAELFGGESNTEISQTNTQSNTSSNSLSTFSSSTDENALFGGTNEDELFGGDSNGSAAQEYAAQHSLKKLLSDKLDEKESQFYIGGKYYHSLSFTGSDAQKSRDTAFASDGVADIYFDAALDDGVRFFLKQKIKQTFSADTGTTNIVDFSGPAVNTSIDQMWLKFDYHNQVYVTLGKQPTSWGSGFVWAPTDFINDESASPFALSDQRLGVSLIKVQYPLDAQGINLYGIIQTNEANTIGEIKSMFRAEKVIEQSELALSISSEPNQELKLGFDFSTGLKWFDVYLNAAATKHDQSTYYSRPDGATTPTSDDYLALLQANIDGDPNAIPTNTQLVVDDRSNEIIKQLSTGLIYIKAFDDGSQLIINSEFFYNEKGYADSEMLTLILLQDPNSFDPLYFSERYAAVGLTRAGLGNSAQTYGVQYIKDLSDTSGSVVLTYGFTPFNDLKFSSNLIIFTGGAGTFNPFDTDTEVLTETAQRVADGELVIPENVQANLPVFLQTQNTNPASVSVGDTSFNGPRYMLRMQLSLKF